MQIPADAPSCNGPHPHPAYIKPGQKLLNLAKPEAEPEN